MKRDITLLDTYDAIKKRHDEFACLVFLCSLNQGKSVKKCEATASSVRKFLTDMQREFVDKIPPYSSSYTRKLCRDYPFVSYGRQTVTADMDEYSHVALFFLRAYWERTCRLGLALLDHYERKNKGDPRGKKTPSQEKLSA